MTYFHPLVPIWSLLAQIHRGGDGQNVKLGAVVHKLPSGPLFTSSTQNLFLRGIAYTRHFGRLHLITPTHARKFQSSPRGRQPGVTCKKTES